jgi:2-methylcitrate dehydratase PrpD
MMTVLERFGEWAAADLPSGQADRLGAHVLDTVGAWLAGSATQDGMALARLQGGLSPERPLDRLSRRVGQTRLTEIDDIHLPSCTTPGSVVVTTALAMAPDGTAARDFAAALRAGYGAMTWLSGMVAGAHVFYRGIWPTYYATPVGAAAVMARLLGLGPRQTADALAIALTASSPGIGAPDGLSPRWLLIGEAARLGCRAAMAAAAGYSGDRSLLDGDWTARVHGLPIDPAAPALPPPDGGVSALSMKPICAARQTQAAIAAFRHLLQGGVAPGAIEHVLVAVPPNFASLIDHARTGSRMGRITSIAYLLGLAAYHPEALEEVGRETLLAFPPLTLTVSPDPALDAYYPRSWPARVELLLKSGQRVTHTVIDAPGDPADPLSPVALRAKFHRLARRRLDTAAVDVWERACLASTADDAALTALLGLMEGW